MNEEQIDKLACALYQEYCGEVGWKSVTGADLPMWHELILDETKKKVVAGWRAAAQRAHQYIVYGKR